MRKPDLFDEIILLMKQQAEQYPTTDVSAEILEKLYAPAPQRPVAATPSSQAMPQMQPQMPQQMQQQMPQPPVRATQNPSVENVAPASGFRNVSAPFGTGNSAPAPRPRRATAAPSPSPVNCSGMNLDELRAYTMKCNRCGLCQTRTNVVFGDGNPNADLMFIGEGPGQDEDEQGLPFVGRSGELLTKMIAAMGFDRHRDVYIANIVKCRPPGNRTPDDTESKTCLPYLERQIELIQPKVLVLLGATPLLHLLNMRGITRLHGQWFDYKGIKVLPTFHPAFLLRDARWKVEAWSDLQVVMKEFGHEPPRKKGN